MTRDKESKNLSEGRSEPDLIRIDHLIVITW